MNEMIARSAEEVAVLEGLAQEARFYSENVVRNTLQLGRVFSEAKERVPHGEWGQWVNDNAGMSQRTAQMVMQAWRRYGGSPAFEKIEKAKLFKLLALPEGQEERFVETHDVNAMTAREVEEAVKAAKAEAQAELERERRARRAAEERAIEAENRPAEIPDAVIQKLQGLENGIKEAESQQRHFAELAKKVGNEKAKLAVENRRLQEEIEEQNGLLQEQQEAYNRAQEELLNLQSAQARGEAERPAANALTADAFKATVREFIGSCCLLPQMGGAFSRMTQQEKAEFAEALAAVEHWAESVRRAMNHIGYEEALVIE